MCRLPGLLVRPSIELRTLHVDRVRLDQQLLQLTIDSGVSLVRDKVVRVERDGKKISAVQTAGGARFSSPWFMWCMRA